MEKINKYFTCGPIDGRIRLYYVYKNQEKVGDEVRFLHKYELALSRISLMPFSAQFVLGYWKGHS